MWEYSILVKKENRQIASFIYSSAMGYAVGTNGVITSYEDEKFISIVLAVEDVYREKMQQYISHCITRVIGTYFKTEFLNKNLSIAISDSVGSAAFKKALIGFDKETDYFIISKNISFENSLFLESFYEFKLSKLRDKWGELIALANENKEYLLNSEAFLDLLKFLVDNIDINEEEVDIVEEEEGYRIFTGTCDLAFEQTLSKEGLVSSIIELSPGKINLYCRNENSATELIKKIFEKRVSFKLSTDVEKECIPFRKNFVKV